MIFSFLVRVFDEKHLVDKSHEGVAQLVVFLRFLLLGEIFGNLALGVKLVTQLVPAVAHVDKEAVFCLLGIFPEKVIEEIIHDKRGCLKVDIEPEIVVVAQLVGRIRERGIKDTEQTVKGIHRNLPYTEESEHMVDTVSVEILRHLAETRFPPCEAVFAHLLPVVGREAPVLTEHGEIIRRRTRLAIHVKQARVNPRVGGVARYTDRYVALERHAMLTGITVNLAHLLVKMILDIVHIIDIVLMFLYESGNLVGIVNGIFAPLSKFGSAVKVTEHTESGVGCQPIGIRLDKILEFGRCERLLTLLTENLAGKLILRIVYALIVDLLEGIKFRAEVVEIFLTRLILQSAELAQAQIHRMEGKRGVGVVGIRVGPRMGHRCVVDGQDLEEFLSRHYSPVNHFLKVEEIAHTEVILGPYREHGDCHTGAMPCGARVDETQSVDKHGGVLVLRNDVHDMVVTTLPGKHLAGHLVEDDKLIVEWQVYIIERKHDIPHRETGIAHHDSLLGIPCAERFIVTADGKHFVAAHHRGCD